MGSAHGCRGLAAQSRAWTVRGTFRESEIEADVLPELTEADLEKLGLPLGPRKRILKAIASLGRQRRVIGRVASLRTPAPPRTPPNGVN